MPIVKDDRIALRKYYPIADIVIVISFLLANVFVVLQLFNVSFLHSWASQVDTGHLATIKFLRKYPGFYFIFQNFCYPGFWVVNNMPAEVASWIADVLNTFRQTYPDVAKSVGIVEIHKHIAQFAKSYPNLVLQFYGSKLYIYSIGEVIIASCAIVYGLIARLIVKITYNIFRQ